MAGEDWKWSKFFGGFIEGRRYGKDLAILARLILLISLLFLTIMGGLWVKEKLLGSKPSHQTTSKIESNAGTINQLDNHATTTVVNHYYPLSDLFNWFGFKRIEKEK
jgi:hypothetical protein